MSTYRIQGKQEKQNGIYYEFDSSDTPLGEGGMGKVYKGKQINEKTGSIREVAIKFMYDDLPEYAIEKARREAAIQFRHDNLVEMLGFIETEGKTVLGEPLHRYHVVSELLEGVSLDHLLKGKLNDQQGRSVPFAEKMFNDYKQDVNHFAVDITKNILSGLITMHDAGYIHRDIDPTNIMLTREGRIKLIDFGIAKKMKNLTAHDKHLTQAGQFVGKPAYAAPELVLGAIDEQNQTTDIYAVGILLFQLIVGHPPFEGDRNEVLQKQLHSKLPLQLIKHRGLRAVIARATEKSRSRRYQSAAEFRVALDQLGSSATTTSFFPELTGSTRPAQRIIGGILIAACAVAAAFVFWPASSTDVLSSDNPADKYAAAIQLLHDTDDHTAGMEALQQLSANGDAQASYLLSRLYFSSKMEDDACPDSILNMRKQLRISQDNESAHKLLQQAVAQNPDFYQALYDLALDYWKAGQRTEAVPERDGLKAEMYFNQARVSAEKAGDSIYVKMIDKYLGDVRQWKENIEKINSAK